MGLRSFLAQPLFQGSNRIRPSPGLRLSGAVVAATAALPVLYMVVLCARSGLGTAVDVVTAESTRAVVARSLALAAAVTASSLSVGLALAWLVARSDVPGRSLWRVTGALPLSLPSYVAAAAYTSLLPAVGGPTGAWFVLTLLCVPYVFLPSLAALAGLDQAQEEAARSLGDPPRRAWRRITLCHLRPSLATSGALVALFVLSDFGAVTHLGVATFTSHIYAGYVGGFPFARGAVLGGVMLVFTLTLLVAEQRTRGTARHHRLGPGTARPQQLRRLGPWRWLAALGPATFALLGVGLPLVVLVRSALGSAALPGDWVAIGRGLRGSAVTAALGASVTVIAALPVALLASRYRDRATRLTERCSYLGHALPGIVVAFAVAFFSVRSVPALYRRLPMLVLAYVLLFLPLAVSVLTAQARQVPPVLEEAARSLGRGPGAVFRTVTGPLLAPGVATALALVFLAGLRELPATLLIGPFGFETLATQAWKATEVGARAASALPSLILVVLGATSTGLLIDRNIFLR